MQNKNQTALTVVVLVVIVALGGVFLKKRGAKKAGAETEVSTLIQETEKEKHELGDLYKSRVHLLLAWHEAAQTADKKLPEPLQIPEKVMALKDFTPETQEDFNKLDMIQNTVSESITNYLQSKEAMKKKPEGLEKLEESINRKRHSYHVDAFLANTLIDQYGLKHPPLPVFGAEKALQDKGLFK